MCHTCGVACVHMARSNQMSRGASGSAFFTLIDLFVLLKSFQGILRVHFRELGRLNTLAVCYAMASRLPQQQARLDLLTNCYRWAFHLYQQEKAHIHHRRVILCSFAWVAFSVGIHDHCKKGKNANGMPCRRKTKNTKPHNAYDGTKYA